MILFQNNIITLEYSPATDVLEVVYPDLHGYLLPEIIHSIDILAETVKNYDVKRVLLDSTRTAVSVSAEESREIATYMATELMKTRVKKLARVQSLNATVEKRARENMSHVQESQQLPFLLQNFTSKAVALEWLTKP